MHHACAHSSRGRAARLARSAPKDAGLTSRGALPGPGSPTRVFGALGWKISRGRAPWLVRPGTGPHLKMRPTTQGCRRGPSDPRGIEGGYDDEDICLDV